MLTVKTSPDQLMNNDTAIYSANFEESATVENWSPLHDSRSKIVWEGHGLLSKILEDDNNPTHVTGKITDSSVPTYECFIEVLIQLHPVCYDLQVDSFFFFFFFLRVILIFFI
jgi:hypothetical protein